MNDTQLLIKLLEEEIKALRSVLSEMDEDLNIYSQWHKAEAIGELLNHIKRGTGLILMEGYG